MAWDSSMPRSSSSSRAATSGGIFARIGDSQRIGARCLALFKTEHGQTPISDIHNNGPPALRLLPQESFSGAAMRAPLIARSRRTEVSVLPSLWLRRQVCILFVVVSGNLVPLRYVEGVRAARYGYLKCPSRAGIGNPVCASFHVAAPSNSVRPIAMPEVVWERMGPASPQLQGSHYRAGMAVREL